MSPPPQTPLPPRPRTDDGALRRVGVEIELIGVDLDDIAELVRESFGGQTTQTGRYERCIEPTDYGPFRVELDFAYLKKLGREGDAQADPIDIARLSEEMLAAISEHVVPMEVVTPPIPVDVLHTLDPLVQNLRAAGARGTRHSVVYAFGTHLNPELPALDAATIAAYLRAFLCLHDWLRAAGKVDPSRQITPYIAAFPRDYVRRVVEPGYRPSLTGLIDDYLADNPDRNRALDMLPLFSHLDDARVRATVDDPRIKSRPTLHYRLADCDIDAPGWSVLCPWDDWLEVERLACDPARLDDMCTAYHQHLDSAVDSLLDDWASEAAGWLRSDRAP